MIIPTVGRVVLFREGDGLDEQAAIVTRVWNPGMVNLCVFGADGVPGPRTSVTLMQPEDDQVAGPHCHWMPYQLGQAAKTEAAEARLGEKPF